MRTLTDAPLRYFQVRTWDGPHMCEFENVFKTTEISWKQVCCDLIKCESPNSCQKINSMLASGLYSALIVTVLFLYRWTTLDAITMSQLVRCQMTVVSNADTVILIWYCDPAVTTTSGQLLDFTTALVAFFSAFNNQNVNKIQPEMCESSLRPALNYIPTR